MLLRYAQSFLTRICPSLRSRSVGGVSDADLLERFVQHNDEAAFELLVWRHGPLVLGTCRRVLRDEQDADRGQQERNGAALSSQCEHERNRHHGRARGCDERDGLG